MDLKTAQRLKHLPGMRETRVQSLGREDPLEKEMATHSSVLAWLGILLLLCTQCLSLNSLIEPVALRIKGFPGSSAGKEFTCNAGNPSLIPGSGRYPGERIGFPFQFSWASLVAQRLKHLPGMLETRV